MVRHFRVSSRKRYLEGMSKRPVKPLPSYLVSGALWERIQKTIGEYPYEEVADLMVMIKAVPPVGLQAVPPPKT